MSLFLVKGIERKEGSQRPRLKGGGIVRASVSRGILSLCRGAFRHAISSVTGLKMNFCGVPSPPLSGKSSAPYICYMFIYNFVEEIA